MQPETDRGTDKPAPADMPVGAYRFDRASGRLTCRAGAAIPLGRRATTLLSILADHVGQEVSSSYLLDRVWPGQIVDPANVAVQISGLRAAIGDSDGSVILTVHGRGYRLAVPNQPHAIGNIPHTLAPLSGREVELANVLKLMRRDRLLVITGLSGTGKTRLALAAARALAPDFPDGQWLVGLNGVPAPAADMLAARIAAPLGLNIQGALVATLLAAIGQRQCLLVLDGAELLGDGALDLVLRIMESCPQAGILITSHVAHRRLRPYCVRLSPLGMPGVEDDRTPAAATSLFLEAASAAGLDFHGDQAAAPTIARICRHLGGVPLGVEIAARATSLLGLDATASASRDPMHALPGMRRPGPSRHHSVSAAMGWAFNLLTPSERQALRALADQPGDFAMPEAEKLLADQGQPSRPAGWLGSLHEKSMLERSAGDRFTLNPLVRACAQNMPRPS
ncbi:ATP-binding protein [Niveispirillum irakense]|uniref:ATP-binding protein n=1 Tax=Niveispirillum irakense TaxID=34011 RepID=UPI000408A5F5|nr:winged helix-turn-helix domain-containing protein [Niveispirillum irakense]